MMTTKNKKPKISFLLQSYSFPILSIDIMNKYYKILSLLFNLNVFVICDQDNRYSVKFWYIFLQSDNCLLLSFIFNNWTEKYQNLHGQKVSNRDALNMKGKYGNNISHLSLPSDTAVEKGEVLVVRKRDMISQFSLPSNTAELVAKGEVEVVFEGSVLSSQFSLPAEHEDNNPLKSPGSKPCLERAWSRTWHRK